VIGRNKQFKEEIIIKIISFIKHVSNRSIEAVADINVMVLQLYAYSTLSEEEKQNEVMDPQAAQE